MVERENGQFWFWGAFNLDVGCFSAKRESERESEGGEKENKAMRLIFQPRS